MAASDLITATIWEDSDCTFLARVKIDRASVLDNVKQADVSTIAYEVFDGGLQIGATGNVTVSSAVFDTLQTGTIWSVDSTGFNFKQTLAAAYFPTGGRTYRVEFKWVLTGGTAFWLVYAVNAQGVRST